MKKYLVVYILFLVVLVSGCQKPKNPNESEGKILTTENKLEEKNLLKCSAQYLDTKENPDVSVQIRDKNYKNITKRSFTIDEINKLNFKASMISPKKGSYFSSQLCAGDKAITIDPLNVKFKQIPKDYKYDVFEEIQFFDQLSPGTYQIYAYYSIDGKTWYVDGNKIKFEVTKNQNLSENSNASHKNEIYIEAGEGKINKTDKYSYIKEFKRHGDKKTKELYLGTGGVSANYSVVAPTTGSYELFIHLIDDGRHGDNQRNATIYVNGKKNHYIHKSENTNGWKWHSLGKVELKKGANKVSIIKDKSTNAAFIMNAFKFTKIEKNR